jgi:hypothetical protein
MIQINFNKIIRNGDKLYYLNRIIDESLLKDNTSEYKEFLGVDTVLRKDNMLFFCETIPDIEFDDVVQTVPEIVTE